MSPRFTPDDYFYSYAIYAALSQLVNQSQWVNFAYSRFHAFLSATEKKKNHAFDKNRTHDFCTITTEVLILIAGVRGCLLLIDQSGDEYINATISNQSYPPCWPCRVKSRAQKGSVVTLSRM